MLDRDGASETETWMDSSTPVTPSQGPCLPISMRTSIGKGQCYGRVRYGDGREDGLHPNDTGYRVLAVLVYQTLGYA
jgi:lysophospholipase L1-like esterase